MNAHLHSLSRTLMKAGLAATVFAIGAALMPSEVAAASKVCAPDNRGCYYTRVACAQVEIPASWTCEKYGRLLRPQSGDVLVREADGRAVVSVGGRRAYILSDALETRLSRARPSPDEFARMVLADRSPVSVDALRMVSEELGIPVARTPARKR